MGEVYRARDPRLAREVAIKVLPADSSHDEERLRRFEQESKAAGALNHPNLVAVFDTGYHEDAPYIVFELLQGETLRLRLGPGPLPTRKAVECAVQIAHGLAAAHQAGIVHRDLKPENVFVTDDGRVKILDFGLAKLRPTHSEADLMTDAATRSELTGAGTVLGTVGYMSPEQVEGKPADARSDIFSFGSVFYEMLSGRRPFTRDSSIETMRAILKEDPAELASANGNVPPALERIVRRCLEKRSDERFQSARDIAFALEALSGSGSGPEPQVASEVGKPWRLRSIAWAAAAGSLALLAALLVGRGRAPEAGPMLRASVLPPPGVLFAPFNFAISPDGARVAFVGIGPDGQTSLWIRSLDAGVARELKETLNGGSPFWAPDSRRLGFFADGKLKVVDTSSGAIQVVCEALTGRAGTWNRAGTIVFPPSFGGPLFSVSDRGGTPKQVTPADAETGKAHRWPFFLPDGRRFLYFQDWGTPGGPRPNGIYAGSLDGGEPKLISTDLSGSVFFASGHLLYLQDGSLMARPFDPVRLELGSPAVNLFDREVEKDGAFSRANISISETGVAIFQSLSDAASELVWFDRSGRETGRIPQSGLRDPRLSADGHFLAVTSDDGRNGRTFIRILDLRRGVSFQLTGGGHETAPAWSPDGKRIAYLSGPGPRYALAQAPADGSGEAEVLLEGPGMVPNHYDPAGRGLLYMRLERGPSRLVFYGFGPHTSEDLPGTAEGQISPDGKWLAYLAVPRMGRGIHVFVQPFPGPGSQTQISREGGTQPHWGRDGRHLFFIAPDRKLMEVEIDVRDDRLLPGVPHPLFQTRIIGPAQVLFQYDVTADGTRFLINSLKPQSPLTLVTNWPRALSP